MSFHVADVPSRRAAVAVTVTASVVAAMGSLLGGALPALPAPDVAAMEADAQAAYAARDLTRAEGLLTALLAADEARAPVWYERRGQVRVDLKRFEGAVADFDAAERREGTGYTSLGLLNNRALAYEGLSRWEDALRDYTRAIDIGKSVGYQQPYTLNGRGNVYLSLGRYGEARADYLAAAEVFQRIRNLAGAIYSQSNAALCLVTFDEAAGVRELQAVARRAPGSIDARAALAAAWWHRSDFEKAEESWGWACDKINAGVLREGGPKLDGCAQYRDLDWLRRIRRWPLPLVGWMGDFLRLRAGP